VGGTLASKQIGKSRLQAKKLVIILWHLKKGDVSIRTRLHENCQDPPYLRQGTDKTSGLSTGLLVWRCL